MRNYLRKAFIWTPFLFLLLYIFTFKDANSHASSPDAGKVQDPVNNGSCSQSGCHSSFSPFALTRANVTIGTTALNQVALDGFQYTGGTPYIINFTALGGSTRPGFEISALTAANANAGTFTLTNTNNTTKQTFGGIVYVGHKNASTNSTWSFNWTAPATTAGNITFYTAVNRSNANNNTAGDSIFHKQFVITPAPLTASAGNDVTICPNTSTQLQATALNASGTPAYAWAPSTSLSCTNCANPTATPTSTTTYTVTITSGSQTATDGVTVNTFSTSQPSINAASNTVCPNSTVTLSSSGFNSYLWSNGGTALSTSVSSGGTYSLTVTDANTCTTSRSVTIQQGQSPSPVIASTEPHLCGGNSTILSAGSFNAYVWSNNSTASSISTSTVGNYSVTVTNSTGCSASASLSLQAFSLPTANVSLSGPLIFCGGGSVTLTANSGTAYTYKWSTGATASAITVSQSANYRVTVYNPCDSAVSQTQNVVVNQVPDAQTNPSGSVLICAGVPRTVHAIPLGLSYSWLKDGNPVPGQNRDSLLVNSAGNYQVVATQSGCADTSLSLLVSTAGSGNAVVDITASKNQICAGDTVTLDAGSGLTTYSWQPVNSSSQTLLVTAVGKYIVNVTLNNGQCTSSGADTIDIIAAPNITGPTLSYDSTTCSGDTIVISVTPTAYSTYAWTNGATTSSLTDITGNYSLTVSQSGFCGTVSASINAHGTPLPDASFTNNSGLLTAVTGAATYQWLREGVVIGPATSGTYTVTQNGNYSLKVTKNGCSNTSPAQLIIIDGFENLNTDFSLFVYPVPVKDVLQFNLKVRVESIINIEVMSLDGRSITRQRTIHLQAGENNFNEELSYLSNGIYVVYLQNEDFRRAIRIVKQNQ